MRRPGNPVHRARRGISGTGPSGPRTVRARARPHPGCAPAQPGHANRPTAAVPRPRPASVSTVSIAPPSATTRPSRTLPAKDDSGRAMAYPDPKIVTWRRRRTRSTRLARHHADLHAQRRHHAGVPQLRCGKSQRIPGLSCGNGAEPGDGSCVSLGSNVLPGQTPAGDPGRSGATVRAARAARALTRCREPVTWTAADATARPHERGSGRKVRPYGRDRAMPPATSAICAAQSGLQSQVVLLGFSPAGLCREPLTSIGDRMWTRSPVSCGTPATALRCHPDWRSDSPDAYF